MDKTPQQTSRQGTLVNEDDSLQKDDPQKTGSGDAQAPGGAAAPVQSDQQMTNGQDGYPGYRPGGDDAVPGDTPEAGDVDPGSTASADETGQGGDEFEPQKKKALPWNG